MAQALTLTVGAIAWYLAAGHTDTRYTMGLGGPFVYLGLWLFVVMMVLSAPRKPESPGNRAVFSGRFRSVPRAVGLSLALLVLVAFCLDAAGLPGGWFALAEGPFIIGMFLVLALPMLGLIRSSDRSSSRRPPRLALLAAFAPLLCPVLAMFALRWSDVAGPWNVETAPPGRAGILYYASVALWLPTAALVAWGIDRLDGSRGGRLASFAAALTLATLIAAVAFLPQIFSYYSVSAEPGTSHTSGFGLGYFNSVRYWRPFTTTSHLPVDAWFRATALMMLTASVATALALRALGQGRRILPLPLVLLVLGLQWAASVQALPHSAPSASAWIAAAAAALLAVPVIAPWRRTEPVVAAQPIEDPPLGDDSRDVKVRAASA